MILWFHIAIIHKTQKVVKVIVIHYLQIQAIVTSFFQSTVQCTPHLTDAYY